jgi:hypothetical protein
MTLFPARAILDIPKLSELDLAYLRLKAASSDEELRESLDLIATLQAQDLTFSAFRDVKNI